MNGDEIEDPMVEAIGAIARSISRAQCMPPAGATAPFELFVSLNLDKESCEAISELAGALRDIASAIREGRE